MSPEAVALQSRAKNPIIKTLELSAQCWFEKCNIPSYHNWRWLEDNIKLSVPCLSSDLSPDM